MLKKHNLKDSFWVLLGLNLLIFLVNYFCLQNKKDMSERRIATDLHYYYGDIEYKNKSMLKTECKLYIK